MAKRNRYTDKFRASALVLLANSGYPENPYKLEEIARHLKVPARTLRRWYSGQNAPPDEDVRQSKKDLAGVYEDIAYKMLTHAARSDVIDEMSGKDAVIAAATATDKMRLLRGLPTEIIQLIPDVIDALERMGQSPSDVFNRIIERSKQHAG